MRLDYLNTTGPPLIRLGSRSSICFRNFQQTQRHHQISQHTTRKPSKMPGDDKKPEVRTMHSPTTRYPCWFRALTVDSCRVRRSSASRPSRSSKAKTPSLLPSTPTPALLSLPTCPSKRVPRRIVKQRRMLSTNKRPTAVKLAGHRQPTRQ